MEHIVRFENGFDCIKFQCINKSKACYPGRGGSHGRHGLNIEFVSKGEAGAVYFLLYTGWLPQRIVRDSIGYRYCHAWGSSLIPADLGYHSKTPLYEGQNVQQESCEFCDGYPCYYNGSGLNANDAMYALVNGGDSALWAFLDSYYNSVFKGGDYPQPAEFKMPLRVKESWDDSKTIQDPISLKTLGRSKHGIYYDQFQNQERNESSL